MSIREIVDHASGSDADVLHETAERVTDIQDILQTIEDLKDTLFAHDIAVGLAAPQIGVRRSVAVVNLDKRSKEDTLVLINPVITRESGGKDKKKESCMSLNGFRADVLRRLKMTVEYDNYEGARQTLEAEGFLARVIAHEVDHLNGLLYVDRMAQGVPLETFEFSEFKRKS